MRPGSATDEKVNGHASISVQPATAAVENMLRNDRDSFPGLDIHTMGEEDKILPRVTEKIHLLDIWENQFAFPMIGGFVENEVSAMPRGCECLFQEPQTTQQSMQRVVSTSMASFKSEETSTETKFPRPHLLRSLAVKGCISAMDDSDNFGD